MGWRSHRASLRPRRTKPAAGRERRNPLCDPTKRQSVGEWRPPSGKPPLLEGRGEELDCPEGAGERRNPLLSDPRPGPPFVDPPQSALSRLAAQRLCGRHRRPAKTTMTPLGGRGGEEATGCASRRPYHLRARSGLEGLVSTDAVSQVTVRTPEEASRPWLKHGVQAQTVPLRPHRLLAAGLLREAHRSGSSRGADLIGERRARKQTQAGKLCRRGACWGEGGVRPKVFRMSWFRWRMLA